MKIVFLSRYQNKVSRGAETVVEELSKRLSKNHQIDILSGSDSDDIGRVIKGGYDLVVPMNGRMQSFRASLGRLSGKYKLVIGGHSGIGRDDIWNVAVCRPDLFVALTDYMASWAKKWAWGSKVVKISNGVDLKKFNPAGKKYLIDLPKPIILSVGALNWYKHHDRSIVAVSELKQGSLLIVGDGPEEESLKALAKDKLPGRFQIIKLDYEEMPLVYRAADVFTLPSWDREAFGVVYLEAMACNIPVVAPDDEPRREIVGQGGILTDTSDGKKFSEALDKALKQNWRTEPRMQAENFSWDIITEEYEKCFEKLNG